MTTIMSPYQQFIHQTRYARYLKKPSVEKLGKKLLIVILTFKQERGTTPELLELLNECKQYILDMKVMPSMRVLMTAGEAFKA